jgi:hypothetical protein
VNYAGSGAHANCWGKGMFNTEHLTINGTPCEEIDVGCCSKPTRRCVERLEKAYLVHKVLNLC